MSGIQRLLRKPYRISKAYNNLFPNLGTKEGIRLLLSLYDKNLGKPITGIHKVTISDHAFKRWNERVGPKLSNSTKLEHTMLGLIDYPSRLIWLSSKIGLIDDDIIFAGEIHNNTLVVATFYGRKSIQPFLNHFQFRNNYQLKKEQYINLALPVSQLESLYLPPIPNQILEFEGRNTQYAIEYYTLKNSKNIILLTMSTIKKLNYQIIELDKPHIPLLNRSVLYILYHFIDREFVFQHLNYNKPDAVRESIKIYKQRLSTYLSLKEAREKEI